MIDAATLRAILRQYPASFFWKSFATVSPAISYQDNWHIDAMAWHLEEVYAGRIKRLIISVPPRHLKSIAASVAFPAWALGKDPTQRSHVGGRPVEGEPMVRQHALLPPRQQVR